MMPRGIDGWWLYETRRPNSHPIRIARRMDEVLEVSHSDTLFGETQLKGFAYDGIHVWEWLAIGIIHDQRMRR